MRRVDNANQTAGTGTFNNYQFDFGLGNGKGLSNAPLKDQKPSGTGFVPPWTTPQVPKSAAAAPQSASSGWATGAGWSSGQSKPQGGGLAGYSSSSSQTWGSSTTSTQTGWSGYQPMTQGLAGAKPAVAAAGVGTTGIGGGIGGIGGIKAMNAAPMKSSLRSDGSKLAAAGIAGVAQSQAKGDVFGDLLSSALKKSNAPINSKPVPKPSSFSMGNLDSSLPKTDVPPVQNTPMAKMARSTHAPASTPESIAGRPTAGSAERDPFPAVSASSSVAYEDDFFSFPSGNASANAAPTLPKNISSNDPFGLSGPPSNISGSTRDPFAVGGQGKSVPPTRASPPQQFTPVGDPFDVFNVKPSPSTIGRKPVDPMEALLSKSTPPPSKSTPPPAPVQDDGWGIFGGGGSGGSSGGNEPTTTELEGLPPPPSGVTPTSANEKGSDFYKNGQFPDAIKWLSWSVELLKSKPDKTLLAEVLTCRISCFKEIGEMKKAVADCSQAIELQPTNVALLMLRSNLYESMEKYKLGVADLKLVLKLDSGNVKARQTLTRLERIAAQ